VVPAQFTIDGQSCMYRQPSELYDTSYCLKVTISEMCCSSSAWRMNSLLDFPDGDNGWIWQKMSKAWIQIRSGLCGHLKELLCSGHQVNFIFPIVEVAVFGLTSIPDCFIKSSYKAHNRYEQVLISWPWRFRLVIFFLLWFLSK